MVNKITLLNSVYIVPLCTNLNIQLMVFAVNILQTFAVNMRSHNSVGIVINISFKDLLLLFINIHETMEFCGGFPHNILLLCMLN